MSDGFYGDFVGKYMENIGPYLVENWDLVDIYGDITL